MTGRVRATVRVAGHVQGVGFRAFVGRELGHRGLTGAAANQADGRVEVVVAGPAGDVRALVAALSGPAAPGRVDAVEVVDEVAEEVPDDGPGGGGGDVPRG